MGALDDLVKQRRGAGGRQRRPRRGDGDRGGKRGGSALEQVATRSRQRAEQESSGGGGGIIDQVTDIVKSVPSAAAHIVTGTAKNVQSAGGALIERLGSAPVLPGQALPGAGVGFDIGRRIMGVDDYGTESPVLTVAAPQVRAFGGGIRGNATEEQREDYPLLVEQGESFTRTAGRIRHPSRYQQAVEEGHILGALLEDVANVSLAATAAKPMINVASRGAAGRAAALRADAEAAGKAATKVEGVAAEIRRLAGEAPDPVQAARVVQADDAARAFRQDAEKLVSEAKVAEEAAGPLLRAYRVAEGIETLGNQGAMLPVKPFTMGAKLATKPIRKYLTSEAGRPLAEALGRARDRIGASEAIDRQTAAGAEINAAHGRGVDAMWQASGKDRAVFNAAVLDLEQVAVPLSRAVNRLRASGEGRAAAELIELVANSDELGIGTEALGLAVHMADGTLEVSNPALYERVRATQNAYHEGIGAPDQARYLAGHGAAMPLTERGLAERRWEVEGQGPSPWKVDELVEEQMARRERMLGEIETATEKAEAAVGRRLFSPEQLAQPAGIIREELGAGRLRGARQGLGPAERAAAEEARLGEATRRQARYGEEAQRLQRAAEEAQASVGSTRGALDNPLVQRLIKAADKLRGRAEKLEVQRARGGKAGRRIAQRAVEAEVRGFRRDAADAVEGYYDMVYGHVDPGDGLTWQGWGGDDVVDQIADDLGAAPTKRGPGHPPGGGPRSALERIRDLDSAFGAGPAPGWTPKDRAFGRMWNNLTEREKWAYVVWEQGIPEGFAVPRYVPSSTSRLPARVRRFYEAHADDGGQPLAGRPVEITDALGEEYAAGFADRADFLDQYAQAYVAKVESTRMAEALRRGEPGDQAAVNAVESITGDAMSDAERAMLTGGEIAEAVEALVSERGMPVLAEVASRVERAVIDDLADGTATRRAQLSGEERTAYDAIKAQRLHGEAQETAEAAAGRVLAEPGPGSSQRAQAGVYERLAAQEGETAARAEARVQGMAGAREEAVARVGEPIFRAGQRAERREVIAQQALRTLRIKKQTFAKLGEREAREMERLASRIDAAPARLRPVLIVTQNTAPILEQWARQADELVAGSGDVFREVMADMPNSLADLLEGGHVAGPGGEIQRIGPMIEDPTYVIGGHVRTQADRPYPAAPLPAQPRRARASDQRVRKTAKMPRGPEELQELLHQRTFQHVRNETAREMQAKYGRRAEVELGVTADEVLGDAVSALDPEGVVATMGERGYARIVDGGGAHPDVYLAEELATNGGALQRAMTERGFTAWEPADLFAIAKPERVGTHTLFIPDHIYRSFERHFRSAGPAERWFRKWWDRPMRAWKAAVLALSPRWHVNNIVGNSLLAGLAGGLDPATYAMRMREAKALIDNHPEVLDPRLQQRGAGAALLDPYIDEATVLTRGQPHPVARSYELNGYLDDMNRVAVWLEKREKLTSRDLHEFAAQNPDLAVGLTREQLANEAAVRLSLRAMGNFTKMTPLERNVIRRVVPFYAWLRHITQVAIRMPAYSPVRTAWFLHLAELYGEPPEFEFLSGAIPLGNGRFIRLPRLNPFEDVTLDPSRMGQNLSPLIRVPVAIATGADVGEWTQLRRPPGTGDLDPQGNPQATPLFKPERWDEAAYFIGSQIPQVRLLRELQESTEGGQTLRYPTGQSYVDDQGQPILSDKSAYGSVAQYLGLPARFSIGEEGLAEARERRDARLQRVAEQLAQREQRVPRRRLQNR